MSQRLRILHVEDSEHDVALVLHHLRRSGHDPVAHQVQDGPSMIAALDQGPWDLVLSDCSMPQFSATDALAILRQRALDVPFIIVSGTIAEETAAEAMRAGAHGFVRKDKLDRLAAAVSRELRAHEQREALRTAERDLLASERHHRALFTYCPLPVWAFDADTRGLVAFNEAAVAFFGYSPEQMATMRVADLQAPPADSSPTSSTDALPEAGPWRCRRRDGKIVTVQIKTCELPVYDLRSAVVVSHDIPDSPSRRALAAALAKEIPDSVVHYLPDSKKPAARISGAWSPRDSLSAALAEAHVLIVDGEEPELAACRKALAGYGCSVETASGSEAAWSLLEGGKIDVIVTDVTMSDMSGLKFLRAVRERDLDVPVILVTANPDVDTATQAVEYGAFRYLRKPVDQSVLRDVVRQAIGLHRMAALKREALDIGGREGHRLGDRAGLEVRFNKALKNLWVAFQPIVGHRRQELFGYEALVRSDEPALPTPADLFGAATQLGRLHELGRAIRTRVAEAAPFAPKGAQLFVNIHAEDLEDFHLFSVSSPLSAWASSIVLEVTERSSLEHVHNLQPRLVNLRALGFRLAVDDLGAGYSGLSSFSQLEPEFVKLDMSLVRGVDASSRKRSVVRSILDLAADLGMFVICEGVETREERDALVQLGADLLQGYLFAKPNRQFVLPSW